MKCIDVVTVDIYDIEWTKYEVDECDWYCDGCGTKMNNQPGFDPYAGRWQCSECGFDNDISEDNIVETRPERVDHVVMYMVTSKEDLEEKIRDYLMMTYNGHVESFDYDDDACGELSDYDEYDDDFELADFSRGGDLTED